MQINVLGLISIDRLAFLNHKTYLGGGGLATAWVASLWEVPTTLYSIACTDTCRKIIKKNAITNSDFFSLVSLSQSKLVPNIEIEQSGDEYLFHINDLTNIENSLEFFLKNTHSQQYIKLPASSFSNQKIWEGNFSLNPQGKFELQSLNKTVKTHGFIFLNHTELMNCSSLSLLEAMKYIENTEQAFIITLGRHGVLCYYAQERKWWYCPSINSNVYSSALGCGDAFAGGFLSAYSRCLPIHLCLAYGTISAYIATKSPNNMVTHWFYENPIAEINELCELVRFFSSAKSAFDYITEKKEPIFTLDNSISNKIHLTFDWIYNF